MTQRPEPLTSPGRESEAWPRPLRKLIPLSLAIGGGVFWGLCFRSHPGPVLAWLALVPLLLLTGVAGNRARGRGIGQMLLVTGALGPLRRLVFGWLFGIVSWGVAIPWIASTVDTYGNATTPMAWLAWLLLCLYLGLYQGLFVLLAAPLARRSTTLALLGLPALWVTLEWLRAYLLTGFPWNLAGYAWIGIPGALPLSAWLGSYGLSFLVVAANVALLCALLRRSLVASAGLVAIGGLLLMAWWAVPAGPVNGHVIGGEGGPATGEPRTVRIVQPNTNILLEPTSDLIASSLERLLRLTECRPGELVVWPESAAWPYSFERDASFRRRVAALTEGGCELLLNSARVDDERYFNSAILVREGAEVAGYDKNQLVPFGEYVPLRGLLPFVEEIARLEGGFAAGNDISPLPWGRERLGIAICFEIIFPDQVAARVREGATILVTLTNDAWYGDTSAPWQHLAAARFRAAENGRPVIRAAITGISAVIDRYGRIEESLGVGVEGVLERRVAGIQRLTFYGRAPWLAPGLSTFFTCFALLVLTISSKKGNSA